MICYYNAGTSHYIRAPTICKRGNQ
eukprot:COSAG01_NODE_11733_length_1870_cov_4.676454_3_plen_24_part_01